MRWHENATRRLPKRSSQRLARLSGMQTIYPGVQRTPAPDILLILPPGAIHLVSFQLSQRHTRPAGRQNVYNGAKREPAHGGPLIVTGSPRRLFAPAKLQQVGATGSQCALRTVMTSTNYFLRLSTTRSVSPIAAGVLYPAFGLLLKRPAIETGSVVGVTDRPPPRPVRRPILTWCSAVHGPRLGDRSCYERSRSTRRGSP